MTQKHLQPSECWWNSMSRCSEESRRAVQTGNQVGTAQPGALSSRATESEERLKKSHITKSLFKDREPL